MNPTLTPTKAQLAYDEALTDWMDNPNEYTEQVLELARKELSRINRQEKDRHDKAVESINKHQGYGQGRSYHQAAFSDKVIFWFVLIGGLIVGAVCVFQSL